MTEKNVLIEFTKMHDAYIADWNAAMLTGDTASLDRMTEKYYVAFFRDTNEKPIFFNKHEAISGMNQSVIHFLGATKKFDNRVIRLRNAENAVVFFEQLVEKNNTVLARLFTIENWRLIDGQWMIVRETEETIH
ncbi:MAG: hypothetical protein ABS944_12975 [Solibacillus sp.]|jgi:hypothetical protein|uniref:hypothetical protein n=1 Tax=unclassified Solibacillus TaxID=2637870 RepID=UPI0030F8D4A0